MNTSGGSRWLRPLVAWRPFRRRLVFHLKQEHYHELGLTVPIGGGVVCPIAEEENLLSFAEIFAEGEYERLFSEIGLPRRWLDVGAHCGYFSLQVASRLLRAGVADWAALLVEPDPRRQRVLETGLGQRVLNGRMRWLPAAVGEPGRRPRFVLRPGMLSSLEPAGGAEAAAVEVTVADQARIAGELAGPYDLIKVDVEGGEFAFVRNYGGVLDAAKAVVIEWHAPEDGAREVDELRQGLARRGFTKVTPLRAVHRGVEPHPLRVTGVELFRR